ncbi:GCN5-related N-acetyltransferase [Tolypothrix sp. NIES-4075]|uniref:GNAT family N-acetyltransferase n=1 Tax=Tolypothrix sp. NIES-4075 TaxID=2005459 RepID=UPI000B5C84E2|nr:GNAT family N-acetyltransferase [Tolypothrix sp. NIES-4075]GAX40713.1 GCN5-related N-acetyltransferase [Tolypothrix sp. NIES-4075]
MKEELKHKFYISTDKSKLDIKAIHDFLQSFYCYENIPLTIVEKSIKNSLCFGLYESNTQLGFARVITDYATSALLKDVFILEPYRGQGLGKWFVNYILEYPELQDVQRWLLGTKDAHGLYRRYGFKNLTEPEKIMMRLNHNAHQL